MIFLVGVFWFFVWSLNGVIKIFFFLFIVSLLEVSIGFLLFLLIRVIKNFCRILFVLFDILKLNLFVVVLLELVWMYIILFVVKLSWVNEVRCILGKFKCFRCFLSGCLIIEYCSFLLLFFLLLVFRKFVEIIICEFCVRWIFLFMIVGWIWLFVYIFM